MWFAREEKSAIQAYILDRELEILIILEGIDTTTGEYNSINPQGQLVDVLLCCVRYSFFHYLCHNSFVFFSILEWLRMHCTG